MAWDEATNSTAVFRAYLADLLAPLDVLSGAFANIDRYKLACFNATVTPDRNATAVASTYASAGWPAAAEVIDTGPNGLWPVGGNMRRFDVRPSPDRVAVTMAPYTVGPVTMGAPAGDFLYEHGIGPLAPVAGRGAAYHYWGGITPVTNGSLTITWTNDVLWALVWA